MSAAYVICGLLLGVALSRSSPEQPQWMILIVPSAICLIFAICIDVDSRGRNS